MITTFPLGISYLNFSTAHTTPEERWLIPVTDSNGHIVRDPITGEVLLGPRRGKIQESIKMKFYGVKIRKEFEIGQSILMGVSIAPGILNYEETGDFVGYNSKINGSSLAIRYWPYRPIPGRSKLECIFTSLAF
ncbi:MAG: hypothetical protein U5L96_21210 [Owenweeksia sp.]|nr:hypothetical protein [Owenweeksia sp.]